MAMDFPEGDLYEILEKLSSERRSGRLLIRHWGEREGIIGLSEGRVVHCQVGSLRGKEALEVIKGWTTISAVFHDNVESLAVDVAEETSELLASLEKRWEEIRRLREFVPGPDAVFVLSSSVQEGRVTLDARLWKVLALIDGRNSLKDICLRLKASEFSVTKALAFLAQKKMIKMATAERPLRSELKEKFLRELEDRLVDHIGPIASLMVDEALAELGKSRDYIAKADLPIIVEKISHVLEEEEERIRFQREMLSTIQTILALSRQTEEIK